MLPEEMELIAEWIEAVGLEFEDLNIKYVCEDWLTILQMVESGLGYAIVPAYQKTLNGLSPARI